jgi:predicted DNA binding protein
MIEAELLVRIPKMWITEMSKRHEISIRVVNRRQSGKQGVRDLVEITGAQEELESVVKELELEPWVKTFDLDFVEDGKLMGEVVTHKCLACSLLARTRSHLVSARGQKDGKILWHVMTSSRDEIKALVKQLEEARFEAELVKLAPIDSREVLTRRQEEIIMIAYERGFFETPRKIKLRDLARLTRVSQATLSEILRKGQKKIVVDYLRTRQRPT